MRALGHWRWLPLFALVTCLVPVASAGDVGATSPLADARSWLARMHAAANSGNYRGTMVFSAGGAMSSSRVWHYCVGDDTYETLEALDGQQQRIYRQNDRVHTLWPQSRTAVVERRPLISGWQTTPQAVDPRALEQYELRREGVARVAGRDAVVFLLEPRDDLRFPQRLWADQATGLMLRADVLGPGPARAVLESAAFSEVEVGIKPQPKPLIEAIRGLDGYRIVKPQQQRTRLEDEGWAMARPVPGFTLSGCVKRPLDSAGADGQRPGDPVLQAVFSDGLAQVSMFIEPFDERRHRSDMQARMGATTTISLRRQDHWITVIGDAPATTLKQFADGLQRQR